MMAGDRLARLASKKGLTAVSHGSKKNYIRALILSAFLVVPAQSAIANLFSPADWEGFHNLYQRTLAINGDLATLIVNPPPSAAPNNAFREKLESAERTQGCLIELAGNFDAFVVELNHVGTLVGLAGKMADGRDELFVIRVLRSDASYLLAQLEFYRRRTNLTVVKCSQEGATVAKSQEILRTYTDAASLMQSIIKKIGAIPPQ
jgi:hypothetical protein